MAKKRPTLEETVEKLAQIAEKHLSTMPEEEQEERVAAFNRRTITPLRDKTSKPAKTARTRACRVSAQGQ